MNEKELIVLTKSAQNPKLYISLVKGVTIGVMEVGR